MHREQLIFVRGTSIKSQARTLPADYYNKLQLLFAHAHNKQVFIPIRSMQFLAVFDKQEVIFVHSSSKQCIQLSWHHFKPQQRDTLHDPVAYQCDYYEAESLDIMLRLHGEFYRALEIMEEKQPKPKPASVTSLLDRKKQQDNS